MLKLYNTLTDKKEVFKPRHGKNVDMFVCGITPYDSAHIGNFRVFIVYDMMARYLRFRGYKVFYLQNVTDIDDKIINAAKEKNTTPRAVAEHYFKEFLAVNKQLNIKSVSKYAKATKYIKQIIAQIKRLIKKGYAYEHNGSVYFEVKKFKRYGALSRQKLAMLHTSERLEEDPNKKHPYDFVLWKAKKEGEPFWKSPWGEGRPGWHIEDTAISEHFFGQQYDIHGGGVDLKFPHHEAEIAQQESASGKRPMVKYWAHTGMLMVNGAKMSKSLGNFITSKDMVARHRPDCFRFMMLSAHHRSLIDYSEKLMAQAQKTLDSLRTFAQELKKKTGKTGAAFDVEPYAKKFFAHMDDDFNTPSALAAMFTLMHDVRAKGMLSPLAARSVLAFLKAAEEIFGVPFTKAKKLSVPKDITDMARRREQLRKAGKWEEADVLREEIRKQGYQLKDVPGGFEIIPLSE